MTISGGIRSSLGERRKRCAEHVARQNKRLRRQAEQEQKYPLGQGHEVLGGGPSHEHSEVAAEATAGEPVDNIDSAGGEKHPDQEVVQDILATKSIFVWKGQPRKIVIVHREPSCHCHECVKLQDMIEEQGGERVNKKRIFLEKKRGNQSAVEVFLTSGGTSTIVLPDVEMNQIKEEVGGDDVVLKKIHLLTPEWVMSSIKAGEVLAITEENRARFIWAQPSPKFPVAAASKKNASFPPSRAWLVVRAVGQGAEGTAITPATSVQEELTSAEVEGGGGPATISGTLNHKLSKLFEELSQNCKAMGRDDKQNLFRTKTYKMAADLMQRVPEITMRNWQEVMRPYRDRNRGGIGQSVWEKIEEYMRTGRIGKLEGQRAEPKLQAMKELCEIHGVGQVLAAKLHEQGARSVEDLRGKAVFNGILLSEEVQSGVKYHRDMKKKIPRAEVESIANYLREVVHEVLVDIGRDADGVKFELMGSFRRGKLESHDVDVMLAMKDNEGVLKRVIDKIEVRIGKDNIVHLKQHRNHERRQRYAEEDDDNVGGRSGTETYMGMFRPPPGVGDPSMMRRFDIRSYPISAYPYAQLHMTGSDHFNRSMRLFAKKKGLRLSDNGMYWRVDENIKELQRQSVADCYTEEDVFQYLELQYVPPHERHSNSWKIAQGGAREDVPTVAPLEYYTTDEEHKDTGHG